MSSERDVPLVNESLWAAQRIWDNSTANSQFAFPRYNKTDQTNANSANAALNKWMMLHLPDCCSIHSMRHAMRDLILTGVTSALVELSASSGSEIDITGECEHLDARASSGATIEANELRCDTVDVTASSGASADVFAREALESRASSGGDVDVYGSPSSTDISDSSGGGTDLKN